VTPKSLFYAHGSGYQVVELPYVGDKVSMLLLVPDTGKFDTFEAGLNTAQIEAILKDLNPKMVALKLPKFQFEASFGLVETLSKMGMRDAFDPQLADFSGMDGSHNLNISNVLHKAFVAVDEEGTEAAAATAVIVGETAMPVMDVELIVDRPFIFIIRDKPSGTVLFVGRVLNPTQ
jgi:serpin B